MKTRNLILVGVTGLMVAVFFWPTLYRYDRLSFGKGGSFPVRINRITGSAAYFDGTAWVEEQQAQPAEALPRSALAKVTGNAGLTGGRFSGTLYNGSGAWTLREITISVTALDARKPDIFDELAAEPTIGVTPTPAHGPWEKFARRDSLVVRWSRVYRVPIKIAPLSSGTIDVKVADADDRDVQKIEWYIVTASGNFDRTVRVPLTPPRPENTPKVDLDFDATPGAGAP